MIIKSIESWIYLGIAILLLIITPFLWIYPFFVMFLVLKNRLWKVLILLLPLIYYECWILYQIFNELIWGKQEIGMFLFVGSMFCILPCAVGFFIQVYLRDKKKKEITI